MASTTPVTAQLPETAAPVAATTQQHPLAEQVATPAGTHDSAKDEPDRAKEEQKQQKQQQGDAKDADKTKDTGPVHEELLDRHTHHGKRMIAIAVDHSEHSRYCFDWAVKNLLDPKTDQVTLFNVRETPGGGSSYIYGDLYNWWDETEKENMAASHKLLKKLGGEIIKEGFPCRAIALRGDAREELVRKAGEISADMLVVGARGMGTLKRAILGSVSDHCAHNSPCPVVVVRRTARDLKQRREDKAKEPSHPAAAQHDDGPETLETKEPAPGGLAGA